MITADALDQGREAFRLRAWKDAFAQLSAADLQDALDPSDLELLATAALLIGKETDSVEIWTRAHHAFLDLDDPERAVRCAFRIGMELMHKGDVGQAGGWFGRARGLLEGRQDSAEHGYVLVPFGLQSLFGGDAATAYPIFTHVREIADRFADPDLMAFAGLGGGAALIALGRIAEGVASLDQAMLAVTSGEVSPITAGIVYCASIEEFQGVFDWRRAQEWTTALTRWVESQPDLVPFRGQCLVHRSEVMQFHGAWPAAMDEARRAQEWLSDPPAPAVGSAYYQLGEIHRLCGEFAKAEEAYRQASQIGRSPQPGLALLRLAQGQLDTASAAIRREVDEAHDLVNRSKLLPAFVEIMLAAQDVAAARKAANELSKIAGEIGVPLLRALAAHADGAVLLVEDDARKALTALRPAWTEWQEMEAPYEAARVRVLIGIACRKLGDSDTAELELDAARGVFRQLGAATALARVDELSGKVAPAKTAGGMTAREVEVLRLVAAGKTNRAIAAELVLSEKTVARHVSNIFTKLGLSSRAGATAYAYEHDLV